MNKVKVVVNIAGFQKGILKSTFSEVEPKSREETFVSVRNNPVAI